MNRTAHHLLRILVGMLLLSGTSFAKPTRLPYEYSRVGAPTDQVTSVTAGTVMMGGSTDVDAAFTWLCTSSGGGDFLVLRARGTDAYNPYVQQLCPELNSVATLIVPDAEAANHPDVAGFIAQAEVIWFAGGDQSDYVLGWTGTSLQVAVQARIDAGVPLGGTSAGLNVLTPFIYSAEASQGVTSDQALADPFHRRITLARGFVDIPELENTLGDPHFGARDRMGRDLAFLARVADNGWSDAPRGIAVDERTALLVQGDGGASVVGEGHVYFMQAPGLPEVCVARMPLTYRNIDVYRIDAFGSFELSTWLGADGVNYEVSAENGALVSTQPGGAVY